MNLETIAHYRILDKLGAGGMGEVYLAEDTRLGRKVALKLLPAAFTQDAARVRRFVQEAKAASALNHPNILTIHEIGEAITTTGAAHFIATEFIDGQTLRAQLTREPLSLNLALDFVVQIAAALAAAHEAGIVHRDIKPENVMLRRDGIVKVLDFGLAKLIEKPRSVVESEAPTLAKVANTDPGTVLGTASYMSPEQARGQEVDTRSDIFSLGVMLYEMIAGRAPFTGVNALDVISDILKSEPAPLSAHTTDVPAELQRLVSKALRKDREERYQHIKDLLLDLKDLKHELEFAAKLKGAQAFGVAGSGGSVETPPAGRTTNAQPAEAVTNGMTMARATSSAEFILGEIKRHKTGVLIGLAGLLVVVAGLGYGVYRYSTLEQTAPRFQNVKLTRLTSVGTVNAQSVSISPDGKFITYAQVEAGQRSLWTKAIATGSAVQIVPPTENDLYNTTFSPNGDYVYYQRQEGQPTLYQVPVLGGASKKILAEIYSQITFSPAGQQFAFLRSGPDKNKTQLIVVNADGSGERVLAERPSSERVRSPAWSPDGATIVVLAARREGEKSKRLLLSLTVKDGKEQLSVELSQRLQGFNDLRWLKEGKGLVLTAYEEDSSNNQIWQVEYPSGELRRITNDLANYPSLSLTADNRMLAANQVENYANLWLTPLRAGEPAQQITRGNQRWGLWGLRWMPDGRIVYGAMNNNKVDLWLMNAGGRNARQVTDDALGELNPLVTPDGRSLIFVSTRFGKFNLWRTALDGSNPQQLTTGETEPWFDLSPDGRWVVFLSREAQIVKLCKIALEGGSPVQLHEGHLTRPSISPDGKLIACLSRDTQSAQSKLALLRFEGGAPVKTFEGRFANNNSLPLRWMPGGRAVLYVDTRQSSTNLWRLPLNGSPPQQVTNFNDTKLERIMNFDLSRDGKQLVIARSSQNADVVLISEVK
jgi:eukaryotic-like serine/threonine-protein kinase